MIKFVRNLIILVPAAALIYSSVFYTFFFSHFDNINTSFLTISDYFDKSVSLLSIVVPIITLYGLAVIGVIDTFYQQPKEGNEKTDRKKLHSKNLRNLYLFIALSLLLIFLIFIVDWGQPVVTGILLYISFGFGAVFTFDKFIEKTGVSGLGVQIYLAILFLFVVAAAHATSYANSIREKYGNNLSEESALIAVFKNGYLRVESGRLVVYDRDLREIISTKIQPRYKAPLACWEGVDFFCPSDFPEDADSTKHL